MTTKRLNELVTVRGRFHRSVSLTRDWRGGRDLSEYIVTPAVQAISEQILDEVRRDGGARAWSLTGPYGTGKSAFALFIADVLASKTPAHEIGRHLRGKYLAKHRPFVPLLLQAERAPLLPAILAALANEAKSVSRAIAARARRLLEDGSPSGSSVAELLCDAAESASTSGFGGLALLVDEFGKYLEFASANPAREDVFVLQQIAEAASRSKTPMLFVTILHTGFSDYLALGDEVRRAEWQKVQGRFRDVPFQLPTEQLLSLVAHALETKFTNGIDRAYGRRVTAILESEALRGATTRGALNELLPACLPLHPLTALVLWPLFRSKVAQNERSLFAFLTSHEPHGFQEFLLQAQTSEQHAPLYGLPELYDYVSASLGLAAFSGTDSRRWALIDHALHRISASAPPVAHKIVKAIGLLAQYGSAVGLRASESLLRLLMSDEEDFPEALALLQRDSIVLYRRHSDSFGLWEGSDVDLDEAFSEARSRLARAPLHERLTHALALRPLVARAHYVKSGTLRFFEPQIVMASSDAVDRALSRKTQADGQILFLVDPTAADSRRALDLSRAIGNETVALVALPHLGGEISDALTEYECWGWVKDHVTELEGDPVARQELHARLAAARERLEQIAGPVFGLSGFTMDPSLSEWFFRGARRRAQTARDMQGLLSELCEEVFQKAPPLRNELLNRHNLSSAAAKARRNLLEAMVRGAHQPRLGIEGYPPEYSMYASMLEAGGFHGGAKKNQIRLRAPTNDAWSAAWDVVDSFFSSAQSARRPLAELIGMLKASPFGLRDGPIPVLISAALLIKAHEIALYEDGVFVPEISIEILERFTRRPETFEVQSYQLNRMERQVLEVLHRIVESEDPRSDALIGVVKSIVRLAATLPPYSRQTRRIDPRSCAVRDALLNATDPKSLLFKDLPAALDVKVSGTRGPANFAKALEQSLLELTRSYPILLASIEEAVRAGFGLSSVGEGAAAEIRRRAQPLVPFASDPKLQVFVREAARDDERDWREALGRAVNDGKPPAYWRDEDASGFRLRLQALASEFDRLEELVAAAGDTSTTVVSVGVLESGVGERRAVISCPADAVQRVDALVLELRTVLARDHTADARTQLLALASLIRQLSASLDQPGR